MDHAIDLNHVGQVDFVACWTIAEFYIISAAFNDAAAAAIPDATTCPI